MNKQLGSRAPGCATAEAEACSAQDLWELPVCVIGVQPGQENGVSAVVLRCALAPDALKAFGMSPYKILPAVFNALKRRKVVSQRQLLTSRLSMFMLYLHIPC